MMPLGKRADSRYLPVLHIRATRGQTPAFTAQVSLSSSRSSPAHAETNKQDISNFIVVPLQKMQIPELSWIMRFHFGGSENIYKTLETSEPHQKLHGEVFSHTVHFSGLQIPKTGANSSFFTEIIFMQFTFIY